MLPRVPPVGRPATPADTLPPGGLLKVFDGSGGFIMATDADLSGRVVVVVAVAAAVASRADEAPFVVMSFECDFLECVPQKAPTTGTMSFFF